MYVGPMITIGIVEDDRTVREAIRDYCNARGGMAVTIEEPSAERFLSRLDILSLPDVILMDLGLPGMSGNQAIRVIKERYPEATILVLTVFLDTHRIFDSLCSGAVGYLLKTTPFPQIVDAIRMVHEGGAPMSPQIARRVIDYFHPGGSHPRESSLTARELEVVAGLVDGLSYRLIAERMNLSIETVRAHIKTIYAKLHVHCKAEVIGKSLKGEI